MTKIEALTRLMEALMARGVDPHEAAEIFRDAGIDLETALEAGVEMLGREVAALRELVK